jgi:carbon monoxide dehydrogenase subunit G
LSLWRSWPVRSLCIGYGEYMATAHGTVDSPLAAEEVFRRVSDFSTTEKFDPGVIEADRLGEDGEAVELGAKFRVVAAFMKTKSELIYEITEFTPGKRVVLRGENATVVSVDEITVEPHADGSRLNYHADLTLKGPLRLMDPLLGVVFDGIAKKALAGLTTYLSA